MATNADTGPAELDLSDDVTETIETAPIPTWRLPAASHEAVRAVAAATQPVLPDVAGALVSALSEFCADVAPSVWTFEEAAEMLTADEVDRYVAARARSTHPSIITARGTLLELAGRAVNPDGWPPREQAEPGPWVPYQWDEVQSLLRSLAGLPWLDATLAFGMIVVGLAVGATEADLTVVSGDDIDVGPAGRIDVALSAPPRTVPAAWPFGRALTRLAIHRHGKVLSGVGPMSTSALTTLPDRIATDDAPPLSLSRLRATWLASHLAAGTPLHLLDDVAGPGLLDDVARVLPHLPDVPSVAARRWLTLGGAA